MAQAVSNTCHLLFPANDLLELSLARYSLPHQTQSLSPHPSVSHMHKATQSISMLGHYSEMVGVNSQLGRFEHHCACLWGLF